METEQSNPLECSECKGVLLPERAIRLQNEICVLRYVCMGLQQILCTEDRISRSGISIRQY